MTVAEDLPVLRLEGTPYDVGLGHGVEARELIAQNVRLYLRRFALEGQVDRAEIRQRANAYRQVIEEANPSYAEEMRGIAEGARQDLLDIVAINVRYEILYTEFVRKVLERPTGGPSVAGGCTSFALLPDQTDTGHLLLGENWDWIPDVKGLIVRTRRAGHPDQLAFTEAGIAGAKIGLNGAGIGLAINGLMSDRDSWSRLQKPFHVRCYEVLASETLEDAVTSVLGTPRSCSSNFLIAKGGSRPKVIDIEAATEAECRYTPSRGVLIHTNHFLEPDGIGIVQPLGEDAPSTFLRITRITELIRARLDAGGRIGIEDLQDILADHQNEPYSICRHASLVRPENERFATVVSVIMDLDGREMIIAAGNPCTAPFQRFALS